MPEMTFFVRWPDGAVSENYSPSSVILDHFATGETYAIPDFLDRVHMAMAAASDRVLEKYGYPCSRARATFTEIKDRAAGFAGDATVTILELRR